MSEVALWLSGAGTTALGSLLAWFGQARMAKRHREWSVEDLRNARLHEQNLRAQDVGEARFQRLRGERREVYGRLLDAVEEFVEALRDLRDAGLPADVEVTSTLDLGDAHPVAARALRCLTRQRRMDADIVLIADSGVRDSALHLSKLLREAFREAVSGGDALGPVNAQLKLVLTEMRRELVGQGTTEPAPG